MTDPHPLEALLERTADGVPVGPAPTERLVRGAARARRGRVATLASVAAVLVVAGGLAGVTGPEGPDGGSPGPVAPAGPTSPPEAAPAGTRLVGLGSAAIAVPEDWGTNKTRCGVPQRDTVLVDHGPVDLCATPRGADVDSVEVSRERILQDPARDEIVTVDGERARREPTTCSEDRDGVRTCTGTLWLPVIGVWFRTESSTDAVTVDRLLGQVRVMDGQRGVPGFTAISDRAQRRSGEKYASLLRREGFLARTEVVDSDFPRGFVVGAVPRPGSVLAAGSEVVVKISAGR